MTRPPPALALSLLLAACGSSGGDAPAADAAADAPADVPAEAAVAADAPADVPSSPLVRDRPYQHRVPSNYDPSRPWPLVVLLHGYGATGAGQALYLGLNTAYERRGFLLAHPDGSFDADRRRYWNATDACCDFGHTGVDDVAYVTAVIDDMAARYRVDPRRVFLMGHSNGGFMSNRMACDRANRIAAIVSLAGALWNDPSRCTPSEPVSVLAVHGTLDETIRYEGGTTPVAMGGRYPSARDTIAAWGRFNRCGAFVESPMRFDYVTDVAGAETRVGRHEGCMGGAAELWSLEGAPHVPAFSRAWLDAALDWLMAHPRPER